MKMTNQEISQHNHREMVKHLELAMEIAATESKKPNHYNHDFGYVANDIKQMLSSDNGEYGIKHWDSKVIGKKYTKKNYDYKEND